MRLSEGTDPQLFFTFLAFIVLWLGVTIAAIVISFRKGHRQFGWFAIGFTLLPLTSAVGMGFALAGAVQLARPDSNWARKRYGPSKLEASVVKYGPAE